MSSRAIARLATVFIVLFAILAAAQIYVQVLMSRSLLASTYNPFRADVVRGRGTIVSSSGTVLAESVGAKRVYPQGPELAQTIGYVSQRYGESGLEASMNGFLAPPVLAPNPIAQLRSIFQTTKSSGESRIVTTIDMPTQRVLFADLSQYARAGGVVINPATGEVLALASVPSFDPNEVERIFSGLTTDTQSPLLNRATYGLYPPGSTFKIFTAATALEDGVVTLQSTFVDPGYLRVGKFTIHDNEGEATGRRSLAGAFALSSNVDFGQIALEIGVDRWFAAAAQWRIGDAIPFDLPTESARLPSRQEMTPGILAQLGFGQADLLVTPLQMALVCATIAAGGTTPQPILVREIDTNGHRVETPHETLAQPVTTQTAAQVATLMRAVVQYGTGTAAALPNVAVAGKTGTATNPAGRADAWFVAFAPAQAPRVAVAIVVENAGYGGSVAAPIARDVLRVALTQGRR